jgi:ketosteroid isomerase-like protein
MHEPTVRVLRRFYEAFAKRDAESMAACYAPEVEFSDPVFGRLRSSEAGDMWRMLCGRAADLAITFNVLEATPTSGRVGWEARYTFTPTARPVHNIITATMTLAGEKITRHDDRFDFWRWSRMALGPVGMLLGWTPLVRRSVQRQALAGLKKFRASA